MEELSCRQLNIFVETLTCTLESRPLALSNHHPAIKSILSWTFQQTLYIQWNHVVFQKLPKRKSYCLLYVYQWFGKNVKAFPGGKGCFHFCYNVVYFLGCVSLVSWTEEKHIENWNISCWNWSWIRFQFGRTKANILVGKLFMGRCDCIQYSYEEINNNVAF